MKHSGGKSLTVFLVVLLTLLGRESHGSDFKWCVATSGHQIEGDNVHSDWWKWEQIPGKILSGETSGLAANHWKMWREDVDLMDELGVDTYRFSIEWAKIEPREGVFDPQALAHYRQLILELRGRGIAPMVTLFHFVLPQWMAEKGGLEAEEFPALFMRYTEFLYEELGDLIDTWVTVNEPIVLLAAAYVEGVFPPGERRSFQGIERPMVQLLKAHALSYHALHRMAQAQGRKVQVGMAYHLRVFQPLNWWNPIDLVLAKVGDAVWNWTINRAVETGRLRLHMLGFVKIDEVIEGLKESQDFFGFNYYSRDLLTWSPMGGFQRRVGSGLLSDLNWEVYPEGLYELLKRVHSRYPRLPIIVTENGLADQGDQVRSQFLEGHLRYIERAKQEGVPIKGYCHWSLVDNFEWHEGFGPRFGLVHVDYQTYKRTPRPSFWQYADWIKRDRAGGNEF